MQEVKGAPSRFAVSEKKISLLIGMLVPSLGCPIKNAPLRSQQIHQENCVAGGALIRRNG